MDTEAGDHADAAPRSLEVGDRGEGTAAAEEAPRAPGRGAARNSGSNIDLGAQSPTSHSDSENKK